MALRDADCPAFRYTVDWATPPPRAHATLGGPSPRWRRAGSSGRQRGSGGDLRDKGFVASAFCCRLAASSAGAGGAEPGGAAEVRSLPNNDLPHSARHTPPRPTPAHPPHSPSRLSCMYFHGRLHDVHLPARPCCRCDPFHGQATSKKQTCRSVWSIARQRRKFSALCPVQ